MKEFTKTLKREEIATFRAFQNIVKKHYFEHEYYRYLQAFNDVKRIKINLWETYRKQCSTPTQRNICNKMIVYLSNKQPEHIY